MKLLKQKSAAIIKSRNRIMFLFLFFVFCIGQSVFAQEVQITGTVLDNEGMPLIGATVAVKGTTKGTFTDANGKFTISANPSATLVVSNVGFITQEEKIPAGTTTLTIQLDLDIIGLDEVVVIGYGTQRKEDLTSAVVSVKADEFVQGSVKSIGQLIQGKIAGLTVTNSSGNPTSGVDLNIRGFSSINSSSYPLVIVDGIPGDLSLVAPEDVESIDVLKDGSSAAIYGTRGSNGVIFITTKKGSKSTKTSIEYSAYLSTQTMSRKADFYTAADYQRMAQDGVANITDAGYSTDWLSKITRVPFTQNHNLSLRGGNEKTTYSATLTYNNSQGIFRKSDTRKLTARLEVTHTAIKDLLTVNVGVITAPGVTSAVDPNYAYRQALIHNPTEPVYNEDGSYYETGVFQYYNPVSLINESDGESKDLYSRFFTNITLTPFKGLKSNLLLARNVWSNVYGYSETFKHSADAALNGPAWRSSGASNNDYLEYTIDYSKSIGLHTLNVVAGYSYEYGLYEGFNMFNKDFPTDYFKYNRMDLGEALANGQATMGSYKNMEKLIGAFTRLNYNYANKYFVQASMRREGSSKFGKNYPWGSFPAFQLGWKISEEPFLKDVDLINLLKLRYSYGITGNIPNDAYMSLTSLAYSTGIFYNGTYIKTLVPTRNNNPDLRWEKKIENNIGLDIAVLDNRIFASFDFYKRHTIDILYDYPVPMPPYLVASIFANGAKMDNKGFEATVDVTVIKSKDLTWKSSVNFSTNINKLVSLSSGSWVAQTDTLYNGYTGDPIQDYTHVNIIGHNLGDFFGFKTVGVTPEGVWLVQRQSGGDTTLTAAKNIDKTILGNGHPKYYLSWNNELKYKNFDLSISMRGAFKYQILNFQRMFYENPTINYNMLKTAHDKVYGIAQLSSPQSYVSYYIENGDYLKIDNVTLGYTYLPKNRDYFTSMRIYASVLNVFTITGYKGIDPEVENRPFDPGLDDRDKYPTTRTFTLGFNVVF